jgi:hypothetical protein
VGDPQLTGSLAFTVFKHQSRIEVILQTGEGADFCARIFLVEPPLPRILFSLPIHPRLSLLHSRAPSSPIAPESSRRVIAMVSLLLSRYFFPLGESNPLESSSSRLKTDERANYKSFLLDFTIELRSKSVEMELTFSPSLDGVRSLMCRSFHEDILHSTNPDLQSQTQTKNLARDL